MKFKLEHPYINRLKDIASIFRNNHYELFLVGGTIRDALLGEISTDIDLATNATPDKIEELFDNTIATGKEYGTITVIDSNKENTTYMQITTYRADGKYVDIRHPDAVTFKSSLKEDIKRRDFTINALAYDPLTEELIDYENGYQDLEKKWIRVVGDPCKRFKEDSLRLFRCCRLIAKLEFKCEQKTWNSLCQLAKTIALPSKERITEELIKLLESKKPSLGLNALIKSGLGERILPGLNQISQRDIEVINKLEIDLRLAYLLKELDIEICLSNLRLSKQQERWINDLIRCDGDRKKACFQKKDLSLSGNEIKEMGFKGKQIGMIQQHCYDYVIDNFSNNTKTKLIKFINTLKKQKRLFK